MLDDKAGSDPGGSSDAVCVSASSRAPRVSIGIPVYNAERYLAAALDSLVNQTDTDIEFLIADNASTDQTEAISRRYAARDPRVRYFRSPENRGLAWNFNRLVDLARGKYFKWAAYDDLCAPTFIERCVDVLEKHPDVVWCHSQTNFIDSTGAQIADTKPLAYLVDRRFKIALPSGTMPLEWSRASNRPYQRFWDVMTGPSEVYDQNGLIRLDALKRTGLLQPFYGADRVLVAELSLLGRYAEIPESLFFARRHSEQTVFQPQSHVERETSGRTRQRVFVPRRVRMVWSMLKLVLQADIRFAERLRCLWAVAAFAANPKKWKRLVVDGFRAVGVRVAVPEDAMRDAAFARIDIPPSDAVAPNPMATKIQPENVSNRQGS